jgi:hypothetical protein
MFASLRALLSGVIDYAGLFPPAKLLRELAIRNFADYARGPDSWMLGRFIGPAVSLSELALLAVDLFDSEAPLRMSVVVTASDFSIAPADLEAIRAAGLRHGDRIRVDGVELRLPDLNLQQPGSIRGVAAEIAGTVRSADSAKSISRTYCEINMGSEWRSRVVAVVPALQEVTVCPLGFKLRCGGPEASAFPTPEQVAFTIVACRNGGVPLKFTAGLHHPIRHFDQALKAHVHGFVNVFGAGVLAHARGLSEQQVRRIVEDENQKSFSFEETSVQWKDIGATTEEIVKAREKAVISFGSCSFEEPRNELQELGLLRLGLLSS